MQHDETATPQRSSAMQAGGKRITSFVDRELRSVTDQPASPNFELSHLMNLRAAVKARPPQPIAAGVSVTDHFVPCSRTAPPIRVRVYRPDGINSKPPEIRPALLHIHGGAFMVGAPEMADDRNSRLVQSLDCIVVSVDYRLAPEIKFPHPLEDCYSALLWINRNAKAMGVDPGRIAVGGESSGGGLAACLALLARDRGGVSICFQLLIYPALDDETGSLVQPASIFGEFIWTSSSNRVAWEAFLGTSTEQDDMSIYISAARASDLRHLPPAFIGVGALDLYAPENLHYATRLLTAGVPTELHVIPGAFHAFDLRFPASSVAKGFEALIFSALKRAFVGAVISS